MLKLFLVSLMMFFSVFSGLPTSLWPSNQRFEHHSIQLKSAASDEFISYWNDDFRKDDVGNIIPICDITYSSFKTMYSKYVLLDTSDKAIVDATPDYEEGYSIKDSIKTLVDMYGDNQNPTAKEKRTLDQKSSIIVIVTIAVFGMSTICIFFVLKRDNIIQ